MSVAKRGRSAKNSVLSSSARPVFMVAYRSTIARPAVLSPGSPAGGTDLFADLEQTSGVSVGEPGHT